MAVTRLDGSVVEARTYLDVGKRRAEFTANGLDLVVIARDDEDEMYGIFPQQGLMMQSRIGAPLLERYRTFVSAFGPHGKFDKVGHEMCEGYSCDKYNVTATTGQVYYFWYDPVRQAPVKIVADTHRFSLVVTNFKRGPQPAVLFHVPTGDRHERYYSIPPFIPQPKTVAPPSPTP
jgi:hypothetical protein